MKTSLNDVRHTITCYKITFNWMPSFTYGYVHLNFQLNITKEIFNVLRDLYVIFSLIGYTCLKFSLFLWRVFKLKSPVIRVRSYYALESVKTSLDRFGTDTEESFCNLVGGSWDSLFWQNFKLQKKKNLGAFEQVDWELMSKTEYLVIGGHWRNMKMPQGIINSVKEFKYLGSVFHESGNCKSDMFVCSNANPLHFYALRVPRKAEDGVKCGLFPNHAPLGQTTLRVGRVSVFSRATIGSWG